MPPKKDVNITIRTAGYPLPPNHHDNTTKPATSPPTNMHTHIYALQNTRYPPTNTPQTWRTYKQTKLDENSLLTALLMYVSLVLIGRQRSKPCGDSSTEV